MGCTPTAAAQRDEFWLGQRGRFEIRLCYTMLRMPAENLT